MTPISHANERGMEILGVRLRWFGFGTLLIAVTIGSPYGVAAGATMLMADAIFDVADAIRSKELPKGHARAAGGDVVR